MTNNEFSPIVVFAYNRVSHLKLCIDALKQNFESQYSSLIIYCDGPKNSNDLINVEKVRNYLFDITGFKDVQINISLENKGLSRSIIEGITEQFKIHETLIILEDDIIPSLYFLNYMNRSLRMFEKFDNVASIHGYCYPIKDLPNIFFIRGADCWGWATWRRSWIDFELDGEVLLKSLSRNKLKFEFNLFGGFNYTKMLENQISKKNDSWAIRWHASNFIKNKLTLYPGKSLVNNVGTDGTGTNFIFNDFSFATNNNDVKVELSLIKIAESKYSRNLFVLFFYKRKIKLLFNKLFSL